MLEIIIAGGWLMVPIIICSIAALAIIIERFWALRKQRVCPEALVIQLWQWIKADQLNQERIENIRTSCPLGSVLAAGLINRNHSREVMKESIEEVGRQVVFELERFLNTLGTIASISPLLGLLGTVLGMIQVFTAINVHGVGSPTEMAGGIATALITTAAGMMVAIPSYIAYRYYQRRVDELVYNMEQEALKLVEVLHGEREMTMKETAD